MFMGFVPYMMTFIASTNLGLRSSWCNFLFIVEASFRGFVGILIKWIFSIIFLIFEDFLMSFLLLDEGASNFGQRNNNNNNNTSQCRSRFHGVWGNPPVGNLTSTGILTRREADSKRPTKIQFCENVLWKKDFGETFNEEVKNIIARNE